MGRSHGPQAAVEGLWGGSSNRGSRCGLVRRGGSSVCADVS